MSATKNVKSVRQPVTDQQRDKILEMIVDSWLTHPKQDVALTRSESHRIAAKVFGRNYNHNNVIQVAAVRAAYTRGNYGAPATLKRNRKRHLNSL